jgi:hypothetical protein
MIIAAKTILPTMRPMLIPEDVVLVTAVFDVDVLI